MSIDDSLSHSGFAQLYFQAAQVRHTELSEFFAKLEQEHHGHLTGVELERAIEAARDIQQYLERAAAYLHDTEARVEVNYP